MNELAGDERAGAADYRRRDWTYVDDIVDGLLAMGIREDHRVIDI